MSELQTRVQRGRSWAAKARFRLIVGAVRRVKGDRGPRFGSVILVRLPAPLDASRVSSRKTLKGQSFANGPLSARRLYLGTRRQPPIPCGSPPREQGHDRPCQ
jgi:hypothetical protein